MPETKSARKAAARPINERSLLTTQMAADYLSIGKRTFEDMAAGGEFPFKPREVKGMPRYLRSDLDKYIEELKTYKRHDRVTAG